MKVAACNLLDNILSVYNNGYVLESVFNHCTGQTYRCEYTY